MNEDLIYKMIVAETLGRHITHAQQDVKEEYISLYGRVSEELRKELDFQSKTPEQIEAMRLDTIKWCVKELTNP